MNTLYQRSRFWRREMGMTFSHKGDMKLVPWKNTDKHMVNLGRIDKEMPNSVHTHWQQKGTEYPDGIIAIGSTHSHKDVQIRGTSIVIGRTGSSIHYHQFPTCNQISPDPFIRYFLFPWFIL